jgi:hypothetical protein
MLSLWLPILVSTIALFISSFLSWMVLQLHIKDWIKIDDEEKLMVAIGEMNIPDGNYMFPGANSGQEMNSPEHQEKFKTGPRGILQMLPEPTLGINLGLTMLYFLACNATFAYLASFALQSGTADTDFITVFRFVATIALLTFSASMLQHAIWFRNRVTGHVIESIAYALIAGVIFATLWPAA